jgi:hypothetical protein
VTYLSFAPCLDLFILVFFSSLVYWHLRLCIFFFTSSTLTPSDKAIFCHSRWFHVLVFVVFTEHVPRARRVLELWYEIPCLRHCPLFIPAFHFCSLYSSGPSSCKEYEKTVMWVVAREGNVSTIQNDSINQHCLCYVCEVYVLLSFSICQLLPNGDIIHWGQVLAGFSPRRRLVLNMGG